ncbi:MAG: Phospho-N-acetylmuramoyl-pentapeptide-transferase [Candidatus Omnitrophica bacterium ADurb.Bin292]|jgi:phospho-N-acetylmuramoyl-pentapeptide-transferase|nr:MAG: Phospho-N-acetylmuramoyl-pentapeptide-transferase [Candidatus Omnitrophica bacterium ADurb.Bin292]HOG23785.1 phospho-N-acetylmuramoyl-pentapeptide-transferase [Candidatus Omnitrophota bacterium]HPW76962.1 phospho-N-acetylmuramoyl-pentapeptide-transferase [Candidatus Omnitrophota bacterium]HQB11563.1 phospho-N-acetylmuramoyl-pentapeptide-transferase [Candidatus Omnitrophota bacterium]
MLYFIHQFSDISVIFNLFRYITFRSAGASITAFFLCLWFGPACIRWLKKLKAVTDQEREYVESIHHLYKEKKNTPMMGGVLIVGSVLASVLLWGNLTNRFVWLILFVMLWFSAVGFVDDWLKMREKNSHGLGSFTKLIGQVLMGLALGIYLYMDPSFSKYLYVPLLKTPVCYLGLLFIPFVILVLAGSSNALNLTDGLDGLAIGCTLFTATTFAVITYVTGHIGFANYLQISYMPQAGELTVFCAALAGASAGFLWFNSYPAEVFMGDTGSLSLGGSIGTIAVLVKKELLLVIVGGVFVWEAVSVILQVVSFKLTKKRIFLMSPFHHHLQRLGWPESKITTRLWIIAFILAIIGLGSLKVR